MRKLSTAQGVVWAQMFSRLVDADEYAEVEADFIDPNNAAPARARYLEARAELADKMFDEYLKRVTS